MESEKMEVNEWKTVRIPEMESSLSLDESESVPADSNSKQLKQINGGSSSPSSAGTNTDVVNNNSVNKANSCKGCLYYSSRLKADSRNPVCVGLTGSLPSAPRYSVGELEMEANKASRSLKDFRYGCVGYSVYVDVKEQGRVEQAKLPLCVGFEVLGDRLVDNADSGSASMTHIHSREGKTEMDHHNINRLIQLGNNI
ncbi:hypothetical protein OROHE_024329 [Orobanche hederae]